MLNECFGIELELPGVRLALCRGPVERNVYSGGKLEAETLLFVFPESRRRLVFVGAVCVDPLPDVYALGLAPVLLMVAANDVVGRWIVGKAIGQLLGNRDVFAQGDSSLGIFAHPFIVAGLVALRRQEKVGPMLNITGRTG